MPKIAKFDMGDGRVGRFEVPDETTPENAPALIKQHLSSAGPSATATPEEHHDFLDNLTDEAVQQFTAGAAKYVSAAGEAAAHGFKKGSFDTAMKAGEARRSKFESESPWVSTAAGIVGGMATPMPGLKAISTLGRIGESALHGAALGGIQGALNAPQGQLPEGAVGGAETVGGTSAALSAISPIARKVGGAVGKFLTPKAGEAGLTPGQRFGGRPGDALAGVERAASKAPISGIPLRNVAKKQEANIAKELPTPLDVSPEYLGGDIKKGMDADYEKFKVEKDRRYDAAYQGVDQQKPISFPSTNAALEALKKKAGPTTFRIYLEQVPEIKRLLKAVNVDELGEAPIPPPKGFENSPTSGGSTLGKDYALKMAERGAAEIPQIPLSSAKTIIRGDIEAAADKANREGNRELSVALRSLSRAIKKDVADHLEGEAPGISKRVSDVDAWFKGEHQAYDRMKRVYDPRTGVEKPEAGIYQKVADMMKTNRIDSKTLALLKTKLPKNVQVNIRNYVLGNLGRGPSGEFSTKSFLTNAGKLTRSAKLVLFSDDIKRLEAFDKLVGYAGKTMRGPQKETNLTAGVGAVAGMAAEHFLSPWLLTAPVTNLLYGALVNKKMWAEQVLNKMPSRFWERASGPTARKALISAARYFGASEQDVQGLSQ